MTTPVVLVHGWGGSFESTWQRSGFTELLREMTGKGLGFTAVADGEGRPIGIFTDGVDLLGHGSAPKPHDPEAYADLGARVLDAMPPEPVDAVGFSLGAMTLLRIAMAQPHRFRKLVLAGVGRNLFERDDAAHQRIIDALEGNGVRSPSGIAESGLSSDGNTLVASATCETLVAIGDRDFAGPGEVLADALPHATLKVLRNVDHFATPESFGFIDAALEFLDAVPA